MLKYVLNEDEDGVCKLKFFRMATDDKPICQYWHRREGDLEVCNHFVLLLSFNKDSTRATCKASYLVKKNWLLRCNVCEQWFHKYCFTI